MACRISELVLGCRDPEVLSRFWCEVLDFVVLDREEDCIEIGPREGFGGPQPPTVTALAGNQSRRRGGWAGNGSRPGEGDEVLGWEAYFRSVVSLDPYRSDPGSSYDADPALSGDRPGDG